jgi:hypothetical protein
VQYLFSRIDYARGVVQDFYVVTPFTKSSDDIASLGAIIIDDLEEQLCNLPCAKSAKLTHLLTGKKRYGIAIIRHESMDRETAHKAVS